MNFNPEVERRYKLLREKINDKYDLADIIRKYNSKAKCIFLDEMVSIINVNDTNPSMKVNYDRRVWKCFSSGKGGGYLELLYWTNKYREGIDQNIKDLANSILLSDKSLQKELGFATIYKLDFEDWITSHRTRSYNVKKTYRIGFEKVARKVLSSENKELKKEFLTDFLRGDDVDLIIKSYYDVTKGKQLNSIKEKMEIDDIIKEIL